MTRVPLSRKGDLLGVQATKRNLFKLGDLLGGVYMGGGGIGA